MKRERRNKFKKTYHIISGSNKCYGNHKAIEGLEKSHGDISGTPGRETSLKGDM